MGIFEAADRFVAKFFDNLNKGAIDTITNQVNNAKLPPHQVEFNKRMEEDRLAHRYLMKDIDSMENLKSVKDRFKELELILNQGNLFNENNFIGLNSEGELISDMVLMNNSIFSGLIYNIKYEQEFNVTEVLWIRRFSNGLLNDASENYKFNRLLSKTHYEHGVKVSLETFNKSGENTRMHDVIGYLKSVIEFKNDFDYKKTIDVPGHIPRHIQIQFYKNNKPDGEWLEYTPNEYGLTPKNFLSNSYLFSKSLYKDGLKTGKWEWYNEIGGITHTQYWINGSDTFLKDEIEKLTLGFSYNSTLELLGEPDFINLSISNGKSRKKIYYGKSINRLGNDAYSFEITFVDEKLFGFKQLG
jgi:hypothetical protein